MTGVGKLVGVVARVSCEGQFVQRLEGISCKLPVLLKTQFGSGDAACDFSVQLELVILPRLSRTGAMVTCGWISTHM